MVQASVPSNDQMLTIDICQPPHDDGIVSKPKTESAADRPMDYDVLVIGSGAAGLAAALEASAAGAKVLIAEGSDIVARRIYDTMQGKP